MKGILVYVALTEWLVYGVCKKGGDIYDKTLEFGSVESLKEALLNDDELFNFFSTRVIPNWQSYGDLNLKTTITIHDQDDSVGTPPPSRKAHCLKVLASGKNVSWSQIESDLSASWANFDGFLNVKEINQSGEIYDHGGLIYRYFNFSIVMLDTEFRNTTVQEWIIHYNSSTDKNEKYGNPVPCDWDLADTSSPIFYKIFDEKVKYEEAKNRCENYSGRLAASVIREIAPDVWSSKLLDQYWIGLDDIVTEEYHVWSDGVTNTKGKSKWRSGEPNNSGPGEEDCVRILVNGELNDVSCNQSGNHGYICEAGYHI